MTFIEKHMNRASVATLAGVAALLSAQILGAQTFRGGIQGVVVDPSESVVPGAQIKAENAATGQVYAAVASGAGSFLLADLPLGAYTVTASSDGFETVKVANVPVQAGAVYGISLRLPIAAAGTTLELTASPVAVDTVTTTETSVLETSSVQSVPLNGRDFTQLLALSPGYSGYTVGYLGSLNGARPSQVNWQIEGVDNNDLWLNTSAANQGGVAGIPGILLPLDAVDQFSLVTQGGAETGRNPGGTVNLVIQSGGNALHGTAYYYNRNEALAASSPFLPVGAKKNELRNQQYGYSAGGPLVRNRTFFFTTFERQSFLIGNPSLATEPSKAYQTLARNLLGSYGVPVNPVAQRLLDGLWPQAALNGAASPGNYANPGNQNGYSNNGLVKLDHAFSQNQRLSFRGFVGAGTQTAPTSSQLSPYYEVGPIHVQNWALVHNAVLTPSITSQTLAGYNYFKQTFADANTGYLPAALGLNTGVTDPLLAGAPNIKIGAFDQVGVTPFSGRKDITWHVDEALTWVKGRHQVRFGGELRRSSIDGFYRTGQRGSFTFNGGRGPWAGTSVDGYVASLADFLAGYVYQSSITLGDATRKVDVNGYNFFVQDNWQIRPSLTLNYGLRYDYTTPLHNDAQNLSTFVPGRGILIAGKDLGTVYPADKKNFAPRVGLAWQPGRNGGLVLRGAFGIFYDTVPVSYFIAQSRVANGGPPGLHANPVGSAPVGTYARNGYTLPLDGSAVFPTAISVTGSSVYNLAAVSQDFRTPATYNFRFDLQKSAGTAGILELAYVGSLGRHQVSILDINQAAPGSRGAAATRPFYSQYPNYGVINQIQSTGSSNYNSLQAGFRTAGWRGLSSQLRWTWSHSLDYGTSLALPQDSRNFAAEYGNGTYDLRHNVSAVLLYQVPRSRRLPARAGAGWTVSGIATVRTGMPFGLTSIPEFSFTGENTSRVNRVGDPYAGLSHQVVNHQPVQWVNASAFAYPAVGTFGMFSRNQLRGPDLRGVDISVTKDTPISERVSSQLRIEVYNVFNRVNLANPTFLGANLFFGTSVSPIGSTLGTSFGLPGIGPGEPLNLQIALRVRF